jgi:hypothetical protein
MLLFIVSASFAQTPTATLSGVVRDEQGAVIPAAKVVIKNSATGKARNAATDDEGRYSLINMELGSYEGKRKNVSLRFPIENCCGVWQLRSERRADYELQDAARCLQPAPGSVRFQAEVLKQRR